MSSIQNLQRSWTIGITMGDPCGVGAEITVRALASVRDPLRQHFVVFGHLDTVRRAARMAGLSLKVRAVDEPGEPGDIAVADVQLATTDWSDGQASPAGGDAAYRFIVAAVEACRLGTIDAIATAPLNKAALHAAGHHFDGHTELLAHLTGAHQSFMLLASDKLSAIHTTTHVALAEAIQRIKTPRIIEVIKQAHAHFLGLGVASPRIAVAGLNPHCGENGIFGREDIEQIFPAIEKCLGLGLDVSGPISADTVFYRAMRGEFDVVVAHYHDQGHIPTKLIAFDETVNVSLGLPIRRVSVDHGTAFDIAWKSAANHRNMMAALEYGVRMLGHAPVF